MPTIYEQLAVALENVRVLEAEVLRLRQVNKNVQNLRTKMRRDIKKRQERKRAKMLAKQQRQHVAPRVEEVA